MKKLPTTTAALIGLLSASAPLNAAELRIEFEIPRLAVAEYHRPYVAVWIEGNEGGGSPPAFIPLAVLYDAKKKNHEGEQWLKDLRQWWRRGGRELDMPVDAITGATPAVGRQRLRIAGSDGRLAKLAGGDYRIVVEAVREVGGRETLSLPFTWPPRATTRSEASGQRELGLVTLELTP